ncbi:MAG: hypothetical protein PUB81_01960 [Clostridiales bacterium]|nr:hypothetical protein [Clostridiales bacterium]
MVAVSVYLAVNILFAFLLFKRQRTLFYLFFAELFLLNVVWLFSVNAAAPLVKPIFGEEVYYFINDAFVTVLGDGTIAPSMLLLLQTALMLTIGYVLFHTVHYLTEKISGKHHVEHVGDNYKKNCTVSSFDKTATNKIFILHCRLNN